MDEKTTFPKAGEVAGWSGEVGGEETFIEFVYVALTNISKNEVFPEWIGPAKQMFLMRSVIFERSMRSSNPNLVSGILDSSVIAKSKDFVVQVLKGVLQSAVHLRLDENLDASEDFVCCWKSRSLRGFLSRTSG